MTTLPDSSPTGETKPHTNHHLRAILLALMVTFLWSTSWVLIKFGLRDNLPPITFAGIRYVIAFFCLVPFIAFNPAERQSLRSVPRKTWWQLALLGAVYYALTQGTMYMSLVSLTSATLTLLLNLTPVLVALFSTALHSESPSPRQWLGIAVAVVGVLVFFLPLSMERSQLPGFIIGIICLIGNAASSLLGRKANHTTGLSPLLVAAISIGFGGAIMLLVGGVSQGFGTIDLAQWGVILWLAVVNTALAFTIWNKTLQTLTAVESSIINGAMMPQVAILAWIFLGEALNLRQVVGLVLVGVGTLVVQLRRKG